MNDAEALDPLFRKAVSVIDEGDVAALGHLLEAEPRLLRERLESPGVWLRDAVRDALAGFFKRPYLLWFVADDPVRNGKLPRNIADIAGVIIRAAHQDQVCSLQEQLDYTLRLVCWSWIARECGVQIELIDVLLDAGASIEGRHVYEGRFGTNCDAAIYNRNFGAAEHLLQRGATATLTTVVCLNHWDELPVLFQLATLDERQDAFVQAALNGNAEGLRRMLVLGSNPTTTSGHNQSHGSALHHAVWSGSLEAVCLLVEAGADIYARDTAYNGTPLGWARHGESELPGQNGSKQYQEIARYLAEKEAGQAKGSAAD
jgi:peptide-methionine (S)-S-oxide reductase